MPKISLVSSWLFLALLMFVSGAGGAESTQTEQKKEAKPPAATSEQVSAACQKYFVQVRIWSRKDVIHGARPIVGHYAADMNEERPTLLGGYAWADKEVMIRDDVLHDRFIRKITVTANGKTVSAHIKGYFLPHRSIILTLAEALPGIEPIVFADAPPRKKLGKMRRVYYHWQNGRWLTIITGAVQSFVKTEADTAYLAGNARGLLVRRDGKVVGVTFSGRLSIAGSTYPWQGKDLHALKLFTHQEKLKKLAALRKRLFAAAPEVRFVLRAEVGEDGDSGSRFVSFSRRGDDNNDENEVKTTGFLIGPHRLLVPVDLPRKTVQKLKSIEIRFYNQNGEDKSLRRKGKFVGVLRYWQGVLVDVEGEALPGYINLKDRGTFHFGELFLKCHVDHKLGKRREIFSYDRLRGFFRTYRALPGLRTYTNEGDGSIAFSVAGKVLALAIAHQPKPGSNSNRYSRSPSSMFRPVATITELLAAKDAINKNIKPVAKKEENRQVHLGVEWQKLDLNLARRFKAAKETRGGKIGFLITFVYPNSPASRVGLQVEDILLRVIDPDRAEPIDLQPGYSSDRGFIYDRFLALSSGRRTRIAERIPPPFPVRKNALTSLLTAIGEGKKITFEYLRAGKKMSCTITTEQAPPDFSSASKYKSKVFGFTAKELTYEAKIFLKRKDAGAAVIISKVEPGSKAAVAGLYKYQLLTHINGISVGSFAAFKKNLSALGKEKGKSVEFTLEMMGKTRLVKIEL